MMMVMSMEALPYEGHLHKPGLFIQEQELTEGRDDMTEDLRNAQWQILREAPLTFFTILTRGHQMKL